MSVDKWAWVPECEHDFCIGECDLCNKIHDEDDDNEIHNCGEDRVEYGNRIQMGVSK